MLQANDKARLIKVASLIALVGNLFLSSLKISFGLYIESLAVLGDGIDSAVDVCIAGLSLAIAAVISRPADAEHPWGHGRAETVATALLSFALFFAGAQLVLSSVSQLFAGEARPAPDTAALVVTLVSIVGKFALAWTLRVLGNKADSSMLRANAKNMLADVGISLAVLVGLFLSRLSGIGAIDSVVALLVGLWVIKAAIEIFLETNLELMDGSSKESYHVVFEAVHSVRGAGNPHRTRMRRIAGLWDIDIDIEVDPALTVREAHTIAEAVEKAIKERVEVYDIMIHVEPIGDSTDRHDEGFGLREHQV
ncbi:MAG: cation diffusion facilitator family transporter [Treponema sp.]|jgi:cation diffusion facilitator family transporter|nr:cation diffusion facilitator family transporter [Treponema sp.]